MSEKVYVIYEFANSEREPRGYYSAVAVSLNQQDTDNYLHARRYARPPARTIFKVVAVMSGSDFQRVLGADDSDLLRPVCPRCANRNGAVQVEGDKWMCENMHVWPMEFVTVYYDGETRVEKPFLREPS